MVILATCFFSFTTHACEKVRIGYNQWEPYSFTNSEGKGTGADLELAKKALKNIGCAVKIRMMSFNWQLRRVAKGRLDLAMGVGRTAKREGQGYFVGPYRQEKIRVYARKDSAPQYASFKSLRALLEHNEIRIGLSEAYSYGEEIDTLIGSPEFASRIESLPSEATLLTKLDIGTLDLVIADEAVASYYLEILELKDKIVRLDVFQHHNDIYFYVSKNLPIERIALFQKEIERLTQLGLIEKLIPYYHLDALKHYRKTTLN